MALTLSPSWARAAFWNADLIINCHCPHPLYLQLLCPLVLGYQAQTSCLPSLSCTLSSLLSLFQSLLVLGSGHALCAPLALPAEVSSSLDLSCNILGGPPPHCCSPVPLCLLGAYLCCDVLPAKP